MQATLCGILFVLFTATLTAAETVTNDNVLGTWVGNCEWLYARNSQNTYQCISSVITTPYSINFQAKTLDWNTSAATVVIGSETYSLPALGEVGAPWVMIGNGFLNVSHTAGPACYHIELDGNKMIERGQFNTADFSSASCVDPSRDLYCESTFNYYCEMTKSDATSAYLASVVALLSILALVL